MSDKQQDNFKAELSDNEREIILNDFYEKRKNFDTFLRENELSLFTCPGCGYPTLTSRGGYEICIICNWEDDSQDDDQAEEVWGGPNGGLSLIDNRLIIGKQLSDIAIVTAREINNNPSDILSIIAHQNREIKAKLNTSNLELPKISFKYFSQPGQTFLWQLLK